MPLVSMPAASVIGLTTGHGSNWAVTARFWAEGTTWRAAGSPVASTEASARISPLRGSITSATPRLPASATTCWAIVCSTVNWRLRSIVSTRLVPCLAETIRWVPEDGVTLLALLLHEPPRLARQHALELPLDAGGAHVVGVGRADDRQGQAAGGRRPGRLVQQVHPAELGIPTWTFLAVSSSTWRFRYENRPP